MKNYSDEPINFTVDNVLFNHLVDNPSNIKNFICLVTKAHIYKQRCIGEKPSISQLKAYVKSLESYEKYYATKNNKLKVHFKKWYGKNTVRSVNDFLENYTNYIELT